MIPPKSLVIYKNRPALVLSSAGAVDAEKINISVFGGDSLQQLSAVKVREKDIELLHPGPCELKNLEAAAGCNVREALPGNVREAWELLLEAVNAVSIKELAELVYGNFSPGTAWAAYELLRADLFFSGDIHSIRARPREAVEGDEKKREEKQKESGEKAAFLEKLKKLPPFRGPAPSGGGAAAPAGWIAAPEERRFLLDVEALARGRSDKSKTLKELGKTETPEEAHRLLLSAGVWTVWENPHPDRFGFSRESAKPGFPPPPEEDRLDLTGMAAYAIDNPWSDDPDDAVSLEGPDANGSYRLWVHVADAAASILPGSPADIEARNRGATLYLPEGPSRMLSVETQSLFALGMSEVSPALSFRLTLKPELGVAETEIFPSLIKATRLSYAEADAILAGTGGERDGGIGAELPALAALMARNEEHRLDTGAVLIDLPDVHIKVSLDKNFREGGAQNRVSVEPIASFRSADMVRECMILAGEGAARWALQRQLPFPYISQEAGELPEKRLPGLAGAWQLRRCMRPRILSVKPAVHWGLGLDEYTQVTSPLRRYTDLICHQQIRSFLNNGAYRGLSPLDKDDLMFRISAAEAAALFAAKTERTSKAHWLAVYLLDKKGSVWDGVVLDRKGNKGVVIVPALGLETQVSLRSSEAPNDTVRLGLSSVKIPEGEVSFSVV